MTPGSIEQILDVYTIGDTLRGETRNLSSLQILSRDGAVFKVSDSRIKFEYALTIWV
jgi:hypothetical protein